MKKIIAIFCMTCAFTAGALFCKEAKNADEEKERWAITFKNGYFYPQECTLREIFDRSGGKGGYWVEGAARCRFWKGMNVEASGSYFKRKGYALCGTECTEVKIPTLGLGLKYFFNCADFCDDCSDCCKRFSLFLGAGLRVFFYRERNSSPFVIQCVDKTTVGGMVNFGIEVDIWKGLFLDLFVDYNFRKLSLGRGDFCNSCGSCCNPCCTPCTTTSSASFDSCCPSCCFDIHVGGVVGGIGLGYKF